VLDVPGQLPGGLVGAHQADAGQFHVPAVGVVQAERAGGEPAQHAVSFALKPREPDLRPRSVPVFDACQLPNAVARFAKPLEYASFEFSAHHGAAVFLAGSTVSAGCRPTSSATG
jgi:hypothetical protein